MEKKIQEIICIESNNMDKQKFGIKYIRINSLIENQYLTIVLCVSTIALSIDFWLIKRFINLISLL